MRAWKLDPRSSDQLEFFRSSTVRIEGISQFLHMAGVDAPERVVSAAVVSEPTNDGIAHPLPTEPQGGS